ncbi:kinesin domain-containing protein [Crucibulum laeve]|uniref:Kinesin domain-containing protein n=1 Tax=Crucibulum laeve TaxID=68775 RepID=A0A5C3MF39_9AGAR|nr:kinesin domain-containing protein [Crucibulum laeve]
MAPSSSSSSVATSVQVALRIRPPTTQDSTSIPARFQRSVIQTTSSTSISIEAPSAALAGAGAPSATTSSQGPAKKQLFSFDQVHPPPTTQYELFTSTAQPLVSRFLEGFNCTILAYGQTSSGKTFTMTGIDLDADPSDPHNGMGIIPRAVSNIFSGAKQLKDERGGAWNYNIKGSFIELYNEDLIDLLSLDDSGGKREVQIREDKDGHIIWGGLREVNVRNSNEVMNLIRQGTSIRRTNETDMNAQSSRSHAIFSLTLTQKKYSGSGAPPRSSSPLPPGGRSPSRLARPGSMYAGGPNANSRVASPTFGRPATPSFASAMGRGGSLRPASALGHLGDRGTSTQDDDGDWVTIVSKFHFVDLAGSERLKRTAAAGERIKEGISINSGLLALGNVISALGDPSRAKSHTATHVPYRDSKLTRLLQDSLGGNAHTLMIACVSPAEWNAGETINTLKYANRARNIKNRAVVNEKEDGWDDVEWLQTAVTRLRKELKSIKEGGAALVTDREPEVIEGAGKKVLAQMTELQNNYEDLREKFVERTEELTRLRRELGEKHRGATSGAIGGTAKYEEIVGPVIEEYEKTIAAMEAELSLNRAALRHTNEMVEEKEDELAAITERHAATELYVEELRARVAKLTEREASTEAYVRDLEEKMKNYDETSATSSESISDLKREITRFKDAESYSSNYIADLESRLARSDESVLGLQQSVEKLERECERRRDEVENLQSRLETLQRDGDNWRSDLEERERKVKDLEERMVEWERKKKEAGDARTRLGSVVGEVESARRSLEDLTSGPSTMPPSPEAPAGEPLPAATPVATRPSSPSKHDQALESQLVALQQTHTATLADLSSVTAKYRDALREISDLAAQIQEAKLSNPSIAESVSAESPSLDKPMDIPPFRRRVTSTRIRDAGEPQFNSSGRRLFFRQAASAESLHSRSLSQSQSLSQELSSVHLRKTSFSSQGTGSSHSPSNSQSALHSMGSRPNLSISLPSMSPVVQAHDQRSVSSLEKEIMRLQEVLKERESEISLLEESLRESQNEKSTATTTTPIPVDDTPKVNGDAGIHLDDNLSPKTMNQFDHIRKTMENGNGHAVQENGSSVYSDPDESLERLNELMLSMAQKESNHREVVDDLRSQLSQTRRQLDELTALSRDQALNMSTEIEALQGKHRDDLKLLEQVRRREAELLQSLEQANADHSKAVEQLRAEHEEALKSKGSEVDELISRTRAEQDASLAAVRKELATATSALAKAHHDHEESFGKLKAEYEQQLLRQVDEANEVLSQAREEHEKALVKVQSEHAAVLRQKDEQTNSTLQTTEEEYYNALTKLRGDHAEAIKKLTAETNATIERLREEHAGELRMAEIAKDGSISESETSRSLVVKELQEEHAAAIARKEASFAEEVENLNAGHLRALQARDDDYALQMDRLRLEHETFIGKLKVEWRTETEGLNSALATEKEATVAASAKAKKDMEVAVQQVREQQAAVLQEFERGHEEELQQLKSAHETTLRDALAKADTNRNTLTQSHTEGITHLKSEHQKAITDMDAMLLAVQEQHQQKISDLQEQNGRLLVAEKDRLSATLEDLRQQHVQEIEALRKDHDLLVQEVEAYKVAADEFTLLQQQTRETHERELHEKAYAISNLQNQFSSVGNERDSLQSEVASLRAELDKTRSEQSKLIQEASKRDSLVLELEHHRSILSELQESLQKVKDEKDTLQIEKNRSDSLVRDLQAQIARSASPPNARSPDRSIGFGRSNGLPAIKLPPPTPPPSVPPPPAPRSATSSHTNGDSNFSTSSQSSSAFAASASSRESQPDSPSTSTGPLTPNGVNPPHLVDPKISARLEQQAKHIDEQEAMIKTLNKQLTHCESDLQTHMELVSKLETSLGDSEKNLRKVRMQATELARERDTLNGKIEGLRNELTEAKREVVTVRRSIVEEKQSLEQRLDEERKAKERARQQLDSRMEELQRRKSKFACL